MIISKKFKSLVVVSALVIGSSVLNPAIANAAPNEICNTGVFAVGDGSSGSPYFVENATDFAEVADCGYDGYSYLQTSNITLTGSWFNPVLFRNSFYDGNNLQISGISIDGSSLSRGLFNDVENSTIANLTLFGSVENVISDSGLLAGTAENSEISNINATTEITVADNHEFNTVAHVGGLVGKASTSTLAGLHVIGITQDSVIEGDMQVGGLVGYLLSSNLDDSYSSLNVHLLDDGDGNYEEIQNYAGGAVGEAGSQFGEEKITAVTASGDVTCDGDAYGCGGLVGTSVIPIEYSDAHGNVEGNASIGGLVGSTMASISNSYSDGFVTARDMIAGGLVGSAYFMEERTIENSFASGAVSAGGYAGGLIGYATFDYQSDVSIQNTFSLSDLTITNTEGKGGGIIGAISSYPGTNTLELSNNYFGGSFSPVGTYDGIAFPEDVTNVTVMSQETYWVLDAEKVSSQFANKSFAKPRTLFKRYATFSDSSWNLETIWKLDQNFYGGNLSLRGLGNTQNVENPSPACVKIALVNVVFKKNSAKFTNATREVMRQNSLKIINSHCSTIKIYGYASINDRKKKQQALAKQRAVAVADFVRGQLEQNSVYLEVIPVGKGVLKKGNTAKNQKAIATITN